MFQKCSSEKEVKDLFRRLALRLHPDMGGSGDLMILLNESYKSALDKVEISRPVDLQKENALRGIFEETTEDVGWGDTRLLIFDYIKKYAEKNRRYKLDFLESVEEYLDKKGFISSGQFNALVKAYYNFRMHEE